MLSDPRACPRLSGMRNALSVVISICLVLLPSVLRAHPHVFVDVALKFQDDGRGNLTGVEVTWSYDEFFSLLILADMKLDPDGDSVLTEEELQRLKGFDLVEWPEGFEGDLYIHAGARKITLDHPAPTGIAFEAGRIIATHARSFGPVAANGLRVEAYDPTYYVAHSLKGPIILPKDCSYAIVAPDLDAAQEEFRQLLSELSAEADTTGIDVGGTYAEKMTITCKG